MDEDENEDWKVEVADSWLLKAFFGLTLSVPGDCFEGHVANI